MTVELAVRDLSGFFVPNLRRENFAVYEDGVQQTNVTVEIDRAPVTLAVLVEGGGRYRQLNSFLRDQIPFVSRALLEVLSRDDKLAVFSYTDAVVMLTAFGQPLANLGAVIGRLKEPGFSEANLYDALIDVLSRLRDVGDRKALLLISTGFDTFSHATFDDVVRVAEDAATPVYGIGLADMARSVLGTGPWSRIDWTRADAEIETLAKTSGGRAYLPDSTVDIPAIYDDIMEHLRVRYVITYVSSNDTNGSARIVRVALVNPRTGAPPLRIVDDKGRLIRARVIVQTSYAP